MRDTITATKKTNTNKTDKTMEKIEMISTTATKKDTQEMIKALRKAGLKVDKILSGYECKINGKTIFKAMTGHRIYGIRYAKGLFN